MIEKLKGKNFPNLRFPGFEGEWGVKKLKEVVIENRLGGNYENSESITEIPVIKMGNLGRGTITTDKIYYLPKSESYSNDDILKEGDLLFNTRNTMELVGKVALWRNELPFAIYNSNLMRIKVNNLFEPSNIFLNSYFNTKKAITQLRSFATGTTSVAAIYGRDLANFVIAFPDVQEQSKIASLLLSIDSRIQTQKKIIEGLQLSKKIASAKLFKKGFSNEDKYNLKKIGDLTYVVNKKNKENLKLPVYSINNKKGFVTQSEQFEGVDSDERGYDISLYKIIDKETFAYNPARINVGSIGYSRRLENIIISSLYVCFKTTDEVNDEFLFQYLKTDLFKKDVLRNVEGGVRDYLFYENFSKIKVNLPDIVTQNKIAHFLKLFDEKINLENELLTQYENQKKYLLFNLFV